MQQQPATDRPGTSSADIDAAQYADIAKRAQELREKAQQLANDELSIMNQAVDLNLLAKQLAEATMRPRPMQAMPPLPISLLLPGGISNATLHKMQLQRAVGVSSSVHYAPSSMFASSASAAGATVDNCVSVDQQTVAMVEAAAAAATGGKAADLQSALPDKQPQQDQLHAQVAQEAVMAAAANLQQQQPGNACANASHGQDANQQGTALDMEAD